MRDVFRIGLPEIGLPRISLVVFSILLFVVVVRAFYSLRLSMTRRHRRARCCGTRFLRASYGANAHALYILRGVLLLFAQLCLSVWLIDFGRCLLFCIMAFYGNDYWPTYVYIYGYIYGTYEVWEIRWTGHYCNSPAVTERITIIRFVMFCLYHYMFLKSRDIFNKWLLQKYHPMNSTRFFSVQWYNDNTDFIIIYIQL